MIKQQDSSLLRSSLTKGIFLAQGFKDEVQINRQGIKVSIQLFYRSIIECYSFNFTRYWTIFNSIAFMQYRSSTVNDSETFIRIRSATLVHSVIPAHLAQAVQSTSVCNRYSRTAKNRHQKSHYSNKVKGKGVSQPVCQF